MGLPSAAYWRAHAARILAPKQRAALSPAARFDAHAARI
jgi:hypothetical protein